MQEEDTQKEKTMNTTLEKTSYTTISPTEVQMFLDNIGQAPFTVIFLKKDGTQRKMVGYIEPSNKRSEAVPMMEAETGQWKSFNINRVVWMEKA